MVANPCQVDQSLPNAVHTALQVPPDGLVVQSELATSATSIIGWAGNGSFAGIEGSGGTR